jgi:TonB family protein
MKKQIALLFSFLWLGFGISSRAETRLELNLRVYEGARQGAVAPPQLITTSYIRPTISANMEMQAGFGLEKELDQIKRVFNLQDIRLLTEADMVIGEERAGRSSSSARHFFQLNGNAFNLIVMLLDWKSAARFLVLLNDVTAEKPENILTTEMLLHGGHSAVFGFEDKNGKPFFCSFHITGPPEMVLPPPPPPPPAPPVPPEVREKIEQFERGAVKASDTVNPPRLIKKVEPVYPPEARKALLKGYVRLNVRTDGQGNVKEVMVIRSSDEIFNDPAIEAVKQWKYEPYLENGQPKELVFSVSLGFEIQ